MDFLDFLKRLSDMVEGPQMTPGASSSMRPYPLDALFGQMQAGAQAGLPGRMGISPPFGGGPGGPINLNRPSAGDLVDTNNEMGGSPLQGLFGQAPVPLRQPPPGVNMRRGF